MEQSTCQLCNTSSAIVGTLNDLPVCGPCANANELLAINAAHKAGKRFVAYIGKEKTLTTWLGFPLGYVTEYWPTKRNPGWVSNRVCYYKVTDVHGNHWGGYGHGEGVSINLRPIK